MTISLFLWIIGGILRFFKNVVLECTEYYCCFDIELNVLIYYGEKMNKTHIYSHGEQSLHGYVAYDATSKVKRPGVLVMHDWSGRNAFACEKAEWLSSLGYVGFAVDLYGEARVGVTVEEKTTLMSQVMHDRDYLGERLLLSYEALCTLEEVDVTRIAAIGFCFGGLCALDLARSGAPVSGVVSFHGLLNRAESFPMQPIHSKVLALHGYDDPMVRPKDVQDFCQEMTTVGADWQVCMYGNTEHGFMNPLAKGVPEGVVYNPVAEKRALTAAQCFLQELFFEDQNG